jgi:hypothetical protein
MSLQKDKLVFVYLGKRLPNYARKSIRLARDYSGMDVILVCERKYFRTGLEKCKIHILNNLNTKNILQTNLDGMKMKFRKGFWIKTTERFFALNEYMQQNNISECFHAELDNLVFANDCLVTELNAFGTGMFVPFDSTKRGIASLIYVNSKETLTRFCEFAKDFIGTKNDMELLAMFGRVNAGDVFALPTSLQNQNLKIGLAELGIETVDEGKSGLFDAAAIGQWYFGIDPRNSNRMIRNRFVNEEAGVDMSTFRMQWIEDKSNFEAYKIGSLNKRFLVNNLHIHSKIHRKLCRKRRLVSIVRRTDASKNAIITFNPKGLIRASMHSIIPLVLRLKKLKRS